MARSIHFPLRRHSVWRAGLAATALLGISAVGAVAQSDAASAERRFGDWRIECLGDADAACALTFEALRASDRAVVLSARIMLPGSGEALILATTPWGVSLPRGFGVKIDGDAYQRYPFEFCDPSGCHLAIDASTGLLDQLKAGRFAEFEFFDQKGAPLTIPASLTGVTRGVAALEAL
ncbi:MAG: invasion associated locus B family protein [Pseudomonadota bacterium]